VPFLPGIYASVRKRQYDRSRVRSGFYPIVFDHHWIPCDADQQPELLFSFMGAIRGNPVREAIARLKHPRSIIRETGDDPANFDGLPEEAYAQFRREFAKVLVNTKFTLCPEGAGTSTLRIFETMKAGRVPVIVSDRWVPPEGPAWGSYSLIVRQSEIPLLPGILERCEASATVMGKLARQQWLLWFSEEASFHRIVDWCLSIAQSRRLPERLMRKWVLWQLLQPFNFRHKLVAGIRNRPRAGQ
jgi:hypothetical protein